MGYSLDYMSVQANSFDLIPVKIKKLIEGGRGTSSSGVAGQARGKGLGW
jgi:hypothetical protein